MDLALAVLLVAAYAVSVLALKGAIRRLDRAAHPFLLQARDFAIVKRARDAAKSAGERATFDRLLRRMYLTLVTGPFVMVAWLGISRCVRG
jgi:hypothetical protein